MHYYGDLPCFLIKRSRVRLQYRIKENRTGLAWAQQFTPAATFCQPATRRSGQPRIHSFTRTEQVPSGPENQMSRCIVISQPISSGKLRTRVGTPCFSYSQTGILPWNVSLTRSSNWLLKVWPRTKAKILEKPFVRCSEWCNVNGHWELWPGGKQHKKLTPLLQNTSDVNLVSLKGTLVVAIATLLMTEVASSCSRA